MNIINYYCFFGPLFALSSYMFLRLLFGLILSAGLIKNGSANTLEPFELQLHADGLYNSNGLFTLGEPVDGAEPQVLKGLFDTGTFHLWVVSPERTFEGAFRPYDGSKSSRYKTEKFPFSEKWATGSLQGYYSQDTLKIGAEGQQASLIVEGQQFGEATFVPDDIKGVVFDSYDAIFGLDLISQEAIVGPVPPLLRLAAKYKPMPTIGFYIERVDPSKNKLVFGDLDRDLYRGDLVDHPVLKRTFITYESVEEPVEDLYSEQFKGETETSRQTVYRGWNVQITKFETKAPNQGEVQFEGKSFARLMTRSTALLLGPEKHIKPINEAIFKDVSWIEVNRGDYSFACPADREWLRTYQTMPDVSIYIDDQKYTFRPQDYIFRIPVKGYCRSSFIGLEMPYFVIGEPFLNKYYTRFNYDKKVVQMAMKLPDDLDIHMSELPEDVILAILEQGKQNEALLAQQLANSQQQ